MQQAAQESSFDLFRLSRAKEIVDLAPNTVRKLVRDHGLRIYWLGRVAMVSKTELAVTLKMASSDKCPPTNNPNGNPKRRKAVAAVLEEAA